ncbi:MAG: signal peptidase I [Puniceicoccales bacterium]|jgi:signal peptidase I|nr:signal peptidase I [Puniceicoccales bacterium]
MFFLHRKSSPLKDLREHAAALQHHARKVWNYKRDLLNATDTAEFNAARHHLATLTTTPDPDPGELRAALATLDATLSRHGGTTYPAKLIPEWVELIIVATLIACAIRTFFLQPFRIPTNSMYPTYHGMTTQTYPLDSDGPSLPARAWRKLTLLSTRVEARTPTPGEVLIPLAPNGTPARLPDGLDNGILGTGLMREPTDTYQLLVTTPSAPPARIPISVPKEFNLQSALLKTYFPDEAQLPIGESERWSALLHNARERGDLRETATGQYYLRTRRNIPANGRILNFDILKGDMVLVDRLSYHFTRPKIGDPFVFATKNIPGLNRAGQPQDLYYIKRLVGRPGDTLQVTPPQLLLNGAPIDGKPAFAKNNAALTREDYFGYQPTVGTGNAPHEKPLHTPLKVEPHTYYAMGDNSGNSYDSRGWGLVPEKEIIGRGLLILHPFTTRWGLAQ